MIMYTPSHVANFFLEKSEGEDLRMTQLKLLKLAYIGYGWVRAILDRRLFDEPIQAWKFGPVVPSLYHEFKRFGQAPIEGRSIYLDEEGKQSTPIIPTNDHASVMLGKVWDIYKNFSALALVNKTHEADSPWAKNYQAGVHNIEIPDEEIKQYFREKIREYLSASQ